MTLSPKKEVSQCLDSTSTVISVCYLYELLYFGWSHWGLKNNGRLEAVKK